MNEEILVRVEGVSKKFSKDLKTSLRYGVYDLTSQIFGKKKKDTLRKSEFWAVKDVSFELKKGECLGLIGHNGAGKSTLLKMLNGLIMPDQGRIEMHGKVGALIELGSGFNPILTGRENIYNNASVLGFSREEIEEKYDEIVEFSEIGEFIDMPVQNYSSGMKVRLGFSIAAQLRTDILILDEILAVGDASFRAKCFNKISELINNSAVIFVSHSIPQITRICNKIIYLEKGKIVQQGYDLSKVISEYIYSQENSAVTTSVTTENCKITSVKFCDELGNEIDKIDSGLPFEIKAQVEFKDYKKITNPRVMLVVTDNEFNNVFQTYEFVEDNLINSNNLELSLEFKDVYLNSGKYNLNIAILVGERGEIIANERNCKTFSSVSKLDGYAPLFIKTNLKIQNQ